MKKSMITITALLTVAFMAASASAWGPVRGMGYGGGQDCPRYDSQANRANLSQEQQDQFNALRQQFIDDTYDLRAAKLQKNGELQLLMQTSEPDKEKLSALSQDLADLQKQLRDKRIDFALEAKKISPELKLGQGRGGRWSSRGGRGFCGQGGGQGYGQNGSQQQSQE